MTSYIMVYGTLKRGEHNNSLLHGCEFVSKGVAPGTALLDLGGCPGLVLARCDVGEQAKGEIFHAERIRTVLARLDQLESEGTFYKRVILPVYPITWDGNPAGTEPIHCHAYIYMPAFSNEFVEGGEWSLRGRAWGT